MIISKNSVSDFTWLYGCEVEDLPVAYEDRLEMHTVQAIRAKELLSRLMEPSFENRDNDRIRDVLKCVGWNEKMIEKLKKGKQ